MLNYVTLRDYQRREMESSGIVEVPEDFYGSVARLLSERKKEAMKTQSLLMIKEYENIKKIVLSLQAKREEKIALMALRGEGSTAGLAAEEREMLKGLTLIINKSRDVVKSVWDSESSDSGLSRRVRILKDISAYKGLDNNTYGPFKQSEEVSLPESEAEWLLKSKMADIL